MKRIAIIIASPLNRSKSRYLKGVQHDVNGYGSFLASSTGGGYDPNTEIHLVVDPDYGTIKQIKSICGTADLAFIIFSGHGGMDGGRMYLQINERQIIDCEELTTPAKRQITIIDACRTGSQYHYFIGNIPPSYRFIQSQKKIAKQWYSDYIVNKCPPGKLWLFSSSEGQPSMDSESGGQFSLSFLRSIERWANQRHDGGRILLPESALGYSTDYLQKKLNNYRQLPTGLKTGYGERLPIAVGMPRVEEQQQQGFYF